MSTSRETNNDCVFLSGYEHGLRDTGIDIDAALVARLYDRITGGYECGAALLAMHDRPTAVILVQETMAMVFISG